VYMWSQKT